MLQLAAEIKVLEYLQKTKTLKMTVFLGQSFAIGLKYRQNLFYNKNDAFKRNASLFC